MFFPFQLFSANSEASIAKTHFQPNRSKRNSYHGSTLKPGQYFLYHQMVLFHTFTLPRPGQLHILTRHSNPSGISGISFRVVRNMMPPLECSFRTMSIIPNLRCGRFCSVGHALQLGLELIGNDLASSSANNPTGTSTNTGRVSRHTL